MKVACRGRMVWVREGRWVKRRRGRRMRRLCGCGWVRASSSFNSNSSFSFPLPLPVVICVSFTHTLANIKAILCFLVSLSPNSKTITRLILHRPGCLIDLHWMTPPHSSTVPVSPWKPCSTLWLLHRNTMFEAVTREGHKNKKKKYETDFSYFLFLFKFLIGKTFFLYIYINLFFWF